MTIKYFDFFAGIGGFKEAISQIEIPTEHVGFCEIEKNAIKFYEEHHIKHKKSKIQFIRNVEDIKTEINPNGEGIAFFDLLLAGFPCQPFSNVGSRLGFDDERGRLFFNILHILSYYKPNYFVLENVQKLSTLNKGHILKRMTSELESCGYHVHVWDLTASNYGVPQKRNRIFFAGIKVTLCKKLNLSQPPVIPLELAQYPTTWHLLEKHKNVDERHYIPQQTRKTVLYKNPNWCGNVDIDNVIGRPITATMAKWHRANQDNYFSDKYIYSSNPFVRPTIDLEHDRIRRITPLEGFRMQGFHDDYEKTRKKIGLSYTASYKLIGNAVPVSMAKAVIEHLLKSYSIY